MDALLQAMEGFARDFHSGVWSLATLPTELGLVLKLFPDGGEILGVSLLERQYLGISDRLAEHPMRSPVVLHECVHHILSLGSTALCHAGWYPMRTETLVWLGAARLAVSLDQIRAIRRWETDPATVAWENAVPVELINLGIAVHHRAMHPAPASIELPWALVRWVAAMKRLTRPIL